MAVAAQEPARSPALAALPTAIAQRFEAIVFDWDGTAVPDREADATGVRAAIEALCAAGMDVAVVTGTHVGNVDGQLAARPTGPGRLYLCLNRAPRSSRSTHEGPQLLYRRRRDRRGGGGARRSGRGDRGAARRPRRAAEIVSQRLNRRKIDLIPEPEWADPPKARIGELLAAVEARSAKRGARRVCARPSSSPRRRREAPVWPSRRSRATRSTSRSA